MLNFSPSLVTRVNTTTTSAATDAPVVDSFNDDMCAEYASYLTDSNAHHSYFHVANHEKLVAFEAIAQHVAGTAQQVRDINHALCHQENESSNAQLAKSVLDGTCSQTEQQEFERILASEEEEEEEEKVPFFYDPTVLRIISNESLNGEAAVNKLLTNFPKAQRKIAMVILSRRFDTDHNVLQAITNNLGAFTDPKAQQCIAVAIRRGQFGTAPDVLEAIMNNRSVFTDPQAQREIARFIPVRKLIPDPNAWQDLANNSEDQRYIGLAIQLGRFDTDHNVLQAIANNLGAFTDPEAQQYIAVAITRGQFGTAPDVLQAIVDNLGAFTDRQAKMAIGAAIQKGRLGTDFNVLKTISRMPIYWPSIINLMSTSTSTLNSEERMSILGGMKFSLDLPSAVGTIPAENLPELFGVKAYSGEEVLSLLGEKFPAILRPASANTAAVNAADAIKDIFEVDKHYALQLRGTQLVLYPLPEKQSEFLGWMNSSIPTFFQQSVTNVMVYDFGKLDAHGFPEMLEGKKLSPHHEAFATLPVYLQQAIRDNHFDITKFRHQKTIAFVTETLLKPLMDANPAVATQMQAVMQASIVSYGDYAKLAASDEANAKMKNSINELCHEAAAKVDFKEVVRQFLNPLSIDDQARLAVLLGTMAKKGVLGYQFDEVNRANEMFYELARECFDKLNSAADIVFPPNFHERLAEGDCIEQLTNNFIAANAGRIDFHDVFALSVGADSLGF